MPPKHLEQYLAWSNWSINFASTMKKKHWISFLLKNCHEIKGFLCQYIYQIIIFIFLFKLDLEKKIQLQPFSEVCSFFVVFPTWAYGLVESSLTTWRLLAVTIWFSLFWPIKREKCYMPLLSGNLRLIVQFVILSSP